MKKNTKTKPAPEVVELKRQVADLQYRIVSLDWSWYKICAYLLQELELTDQQMDAEIEASKAKGRKLIAKAKKANK